MRCNELSVLYNNFCLYLLVLVNVHKSAIGGVEDKRPFDDGCDIDSPLVSEYKIVKERIGEDEVACPSVSGNGYLKSGHRMQSRIPAVHTDDLMTSLRVFKQVHHVILVRRHACMAIVLLSNQLDRVDLRDQDILNVVLVAELGNRKWLGADPEKVLALVLHIKCF